MPDLGAAYAKLLIDGSGITRGMRRAESDFDQGLRRMERTATQRMKNISQTLTGLGQAMAPLSLAAGGLFAAGISSASNFQAKLVEIQARSGATAQAIEHLDETITQQAANTVFNAEQIGNAYLFALTSGQSLNEALANMPSVLDLAAAGGLDVSKAMDIATNIIAQFNETVAVTPLIVQSLNAAAASSPATINEIGEAFTNAGNVAKVFGLSISETAEIFGVFAKQGIRGAEAGTLLRSMLSFMTRDTSATTGAWEKLGVELFDAEGNLRDLDAVFSEVATSMEGLNEQERIMTSRNIAGRFGLQGFNALTAARGLKAMREEMAGATDASEVAAARMNTFEKQLASLQGSIDALLKEAFTPLMEDVLTPLLKQLIEVTNSVRDFAKANPELMKTIVAVIGLVALATPVLFGLGFAFKAAALGVGGLSVAVGLLTGPVGLLIAAIAALGVAAHTNFLGIGDLIQSLVATATPLLEGLIGTIRQLLGMTSDEEGSNVIDVELEVSVDVEVPAKKELTEEVDKATKTTVTTAQAIANAEERAQEHKIDIGIRANPNVRLGTWTPEPGDTLWDLWQSGDTGLTWTQFKKIIQEANPGLNLDYPVAGVPVKIPFAATPQVFTGRTSTHVVREGDRLLGIWQAMSEDTGLGWGAFVDFVKAANPGLDVNNLRTGQHIRVPFVATPEVSTPPPGSLSDVHLVREGDDLVTIWNKIREGTGVTLKEFVAYARQANPGVDLSNLERGTILRIPFQAAPEVTSGVSEYVVKPGDTLSGIWAKLKGDSEVTLDEFLDWVQETNKLEDVNRIRTGQTIRLPFGAAPELSAATGFIDHIIKPGDNLRSLWTAINSVTGISWEAFAAYVKAVNPSFDLATLGTARTIRIPMQASPELSAAVGLTEHVVKEGDDLRAVWDAMKSDTGLTWEQFMDALQTFNPGVDFSRLREGQIVRMPIGVQPDVSFQEETDWDIDYVGMLTPPIDNADVESAGTELGKSLGMKVGEILRSAVRSMGDLRHFLLGGERLEVVLDEEGRIDAVFKVQEKGIIDAVADAIGSINLSDIGTSVQDALGDLISDIFDFSTAFDEAISNDEAEFDNSLNSLVSDVGMRISDRFAAELTQPANPVLQQAISDWWRNFATWWEGEEQTVAQGGTMIRTRSGGARDFAAPLRAAINNIPATITGIADKVGEAWADVKDKFEEFISGVLGEEGTDSEPGTGLRGLLQTLRSGLQGAIDDSLEFLQDPLGKLAGLFDATFQTIGQGIETWVLDRLGQVGEAIRNFQRFIEGKIDLGTLLDRLFGRSDEAPARSPLEQFVADLETDAAGTGAGGGGRAAGQPGAARTYQDVLDAVGPGVLRSLPSGLDSGGAFRAGRAYLIGQGVQPELIVPNFDGTAYPRGQYELRGGDTYTINIMPPVTPQGLVDVQGAGSVGDMLMDRLRRTR